MTRLRSALAAALLVPAAACTEPPLSARLGAPAPRPGDVVRVTVYGERDPGAVRCLFGSRAVPLYPSGPALQALIGLTARTAPGAHPLLIVRSRPGRPAETLALSVQVAPREFTSQALRMSRRTAAMIEDPDAVQALKLIRRTLRQETPARRWDGPFAEPARGRLSSRYGHARTINRSIVWSWHKGVDIAGREGSPVLAPAAGKVVLAGRWPLQGNMVVIDHGQGVMSALMHLKELRTQAGRDVRRGDVVAALGHTGLSTGPHLHWSVYVHGEPVDPQPWTEGER